MVKKIIIGFIFIWILIYSYGNFFSTSMLIGTYVNRNFDNSIVADVPSGPDTLRLFKDSKFTSGYYGVGTYKLTHSPGGTEIHFDYKDEYGEGGIHLPVTRNYLVGYIKFFLVIDLDQHYEKID